MSTKLVCREVRTSTPGCGQISPPARCARENACEKTNSPNVWASACTPVREALQRLQSEGLIGFAPQRGLIVTDLTAGQVMEIYAMREVLEGAAARFAATSASAMEINSIRRILERCGQATDAAVAEAENVRLHDAISAAAHNDYLLRAMMVLRDALTLLGTTTLSAPGRLASAHLEHAAIVAAITAGDPDGAEQATRAHIREGSRIRMAMLFGA